MSDRWYYPPVDTHLIQSKQVSQEFKISVMQPARRRERRERFPVLYATDANMAFDMLKGISQILQLEREEIGSFILVGIGYPSDSPLGGAVLRARDLTFPGCPDTGVECPAGEGVLVPPPGTPTYAGAAAFQEFLRTELIPFVDERYDTVVGDRTYFGHSGGGGFGLFSLFTRPDLFRSYVISSPGIGIEREGSGCGKVEEFGLSYAQGFAASGGSLAGVRLYLSAGGLEELEPTYARWHITSTVLRLAGFLTGADIPGLTVKTELLPEETHLSVWPRAFVNGVRFIFSTRNSVR